MYKTQERNKKVDNNEIISELHEAKNEEKFTTKLSPCCDNMFRLKRTHSSPRILSKSVPRRNKPFIRYKIARSLSFDIGNAKYNGRIFKSPNSSLENSSFEEDKRLSRSAKIMKALNSSYGSFCDQRRKIKKSLNFNLSPSPKKFSNSKSPQKLGNLSLAASPAKINRTLNFDTSPSDSSTASSSVLLTSLESTDENQNQTPSQRGRKVKKLLHYMTPTKRMYVMSADKSTSSLSSLRHSLKEMIDDIVQNSDSLDLESHRRNIRKSLNMEIASNDIGIPRNLYSDLCDENERPRTPQNTIRVIPESMSAIKKSHKKERSLRYTEDYVVKSNDFMDNRLDDIRDEQNTVYNVSRESCDSEECKDKQSMCFLDDELSDTGSIFDYSMERKNLSSTTEENSPSTDIALNTETHIEETPTITEGNTENRSETNSGTSATGRSVTPENHVNRLQVIQADSIKKSHRKMKDQKKKKVLLSNKLYDKTETHENENVCDHNLDRESSINDTAVIDKGCSNEQDVARASTPEDVNSSRLLLSQFSSVKKSHRKDKHNNIVNGFIRRQKFLHQIDSNNVASIINNNAADSTVQTDVKRKDDLALQKCLNETNNRIEWLCTMKNRISHHNKRSPSKRKVFSDIMSSDSSQTPCDYTAELSEYESTDFQIFTPIKKRKSFLQCTVNKVNLCDNSFEREDKDIDVSRCVTPTFAPLKEKYNAITRIEGNDEENITHSLNNLEESTQNCRNANGRSTPENMSTVELLANMNSIKKSHKKDKRGHRLYRAVPLEDEEGVHINDQSFEHSEAECSSTDKDTTPPSNKIDTDGNATTTETEDNRNFDYMQPSTSMRTLDVVNTRNTREVDSTETFTKTPPNCSMIKSYMRRLQTTSIKKSHRKVRSQRKSKVLVDNSDLSDDGSIYGEEKIEPLKQVNDQIMCRDRDSDNVSDLIDSETIITAT